jgi:hypothetical protein
VIVPVVAPECAAATSLARRRGAHPGARPEGGYSFPASDSTMFSAPWKSRGRP